MPVLTEIWQMEFVIAGPVAWNSLPCSIHTSQSVNSFKIVPKTCLVWC